MAVPIYSEEPTSPFLQCLKEAGFVGWHSIDSKAPNAFYTLIALGVLSHADRQYPVSGYLVQFWKDHLPNLMWVHSRYQNDSKFSDPAFWTDIGTALITDLAAIFAGKPFVYLIQTGVQLDKSSHEICVKVMESMRVGLAWYEETRQGNRTYPFMDTQSRNPLVFVNIAQEENSYFLLYHKNFGNQSQEGFPCFVPQGTENARIPILGQSRQEQSSAGGQSTEPYISCIEAQNELIGNLLSFLEPYFPPQISPAQVANQQFVKELKNRVAGLTEHWEVKVSVNSNAMDHFLSIPVIDQTVAPTTVEPHTIMNCRDFPNEGEYVDHQGEKMHKSCLRNILTQQGTPQEPIMCPICNIPLNDTILGQVVPEVIAQRLGQKEWNRTFVEQQKKTMMAYASQTVNPIRNQPPPQISGQMTQVRPGNYGSMGQCRLCTNTFPSNALIVMDCQASFCKQCFSADQQFHSQGVCSACNCFLSPREKDLLNQVISRAVFQQ